MRDFDVSVPLIKDFDVSFPLIRDVSSINFVTEYLCKTWGYVGGIGVVLTPRIMMVVFLHS